MMVTRSWWYVRNLSARVSIVNESLRSRLGVPNDVCVEAQDAEFVRTHHTTQQLHVQDLVV